VRRVIREQKYKKVNCARISSVVMGLGLEWTWKGGKRDSEKSIRNGLKYRFRG